jgi:GNAT superfamily N-acetyltransferase
MHRIIPFRRDLAAAFGQLNREWIEQLFRIEEADQQVLDDPEAAIVRPGGQVFFAMDGQAPVGTVAVIRVAPSRYELAKMAVHPSHRGRGLGEALGQAVIDFVRAEGASLLYLETNSSLSNAIRLYERLGFTHAIPPHPSPYARADVYMEILLGDIDAD